MSLNGAFEPGGGSAYGGHVYAQSVWAAARTVGEGMFVHVSVWISFWALLMCVSYMGGEVLWGIYSLEFAF
jgi:hypothetical protein